MDSTKLTKKLIIESYFGREKVSYGNFMTNLIEDLEIALKPCLAFRYYRDQKFVSSMKIRKLFDARYGVKNDVRHGIKLPSHIDLFDAMSGIVFWRHVWRQKTCLFSYWERTFGLNSTWKWFLNCDCELTNFHSINKGGHYEKIFSMEIHSIYIFTYVT